MVKKSKYSWKEHLFYSFIVVSGVVLFVLALYWVIDIIVTGVWWVGVLLLIVLLTLVLFVLVWSGDD